MKFKELARVVRGYIALIVAATLLGGLAAGCVALVVPPTYTAKTDLFVSISGSDDLSQMQTASGFIQERMQTYVRMVDDRSVLEPVIADLKLDTTPEELSKRVTASSEAGTVLISVQASDSTPDSAAQLSNEVSNSLIRAIQKLEDTSAGKNGALRVVVSNPGVPPHSPEALSWWISGLLGSLLGFALGVGLAILKSVLDTRVRTKDDVERLTNLPILAAIPNEATLRDHTNDIRQERFSKAGESFRRLRTNLQYTQVNSDNSAILVTSSQAGEGKTTTSISLAKTMAQSGKKVALVDIDLRSPSIAKQLGLENTLGLTSALIGEADLSDLLQPWGMDELYVMTAGDIPPNPTELLDTRAMSQILLRLLDEFDSVILDGPPILPVADSLVIGNQVGRIVVVVGISEVRERDLLETLDSLEIVGVSVNLVLNKVSTGSSQTSGYFAQYADASRLPGTNELPKPTSDAGDTHPAGLGASDFTSEPQSGTVLNKDSFGKNVVARTDRSRSSSRSSAGPERTYSVGEAENCTFLGQGNNALMHDAPHQIADRRERISRRQSLDQERKLP